MAVGAANEDRPVIAPVGAGENLDQRRFAGAVVAKERHHLAVVKIDRSAIDRMYAAEGERDIAHLDERAGRSIHRSLHAFVRSFPPPIGVGGKLQRKSRRACSVSGEAAGFPRSWGRADERWFWFEAFMRYPARRR